MRLLIPDGTRRRELPCEEEALAPTAGSGRTVVVGIRRDPAIRELLTWALVKVANAGDRVAALHIVVAAADGLLMGVDERRRAADSLTSVLAVYTTSATSSSYQYFTLDGLQQLKLDIDRLLHHIRKSFVKQIKDLMECCCFLFCIHSILLYTDVKCHVELEQPKLLTKVASVACSGDADKVKSSESKGSYD